MSYSSGKDVYIHFAAPEFTNAFHNDRRSRAAVMYIEPGGYYERDLTFHKPVVACVVGRWKDRLTKACGHAGAERPVGTFATADRARDAADRHAFDAVTATARTHARPSTRTTTRPTARTAARAPTAPGAPWAVPRLK